MNGKIFSGGALISFQIVNDGQHLSNIAHTVVPCSGSLFVSAHTKKEVWRFRLSLRVYLKCASRK